MVPQYIPYTKINVIYNTPKKLINYKLTHKNILLQEMPLASPIIIIKYLPNEPNYLPSKPPESQDSEIILELDNIMNSIDYIFIK